MRAEPAYRECYRTRYPIRIAASAHCAKVYLSVAVSGTLSGAGDTRVAGASLVPVGSSPRPQDRLRSCMSHARPNGPGHADWRQG